MNAVSTSEAIGSAVKASAAGSAIDNISRLRLSYVKISLQSKWDQDLHLGKCMSEKISLKPHKDTSVLRPINNWDHSDSLSSYFTLLGWKVKKEVLERVWIGIISLSLCLEIVTGKIFSQNPKDKIDYIMQEQN